MSSFDEHDTFVLPDHDELLRRLKSVTSITTEYEDHFFPVILEKAGMEHYGSGVVMLVFFAYVNFSEQYHDLPGNPMEPAFVIRRFAEAIIGEGHPKVLEDAQKTLQLLDGYR